MKRVFLLAIATCGFLNPATTVHASPKDTEHQRVQIVTMCQHKRTRTIMIRELMHTKEGKMEMARMLKADTEFRSLYESMTTNAG